MKLIRNLRKKGMELSPPAIAVSIALLLLILLIFIFIFGNQTSDFINKLTGIKQGVLGERCKNLLFNRGG